ncbi:MAG: InlB B-repeat-containing protein, partial [Bacilli bacterium]|nr:InlB B-repeat-containing protein [Bacilli bacterium]
SICAKDSGGPDNYEGTTAEWEALMAAYPNCGLNIDNVWCSDTTTNTVTFNPNGGAFKDVEGSVEKTVISGKVVEDPGKPKMAGKTFVGWFTEAVGGTEVDITLATSADATYYAHYVDLIGNTLENSIKVSTTGEKSVALDSELQAAYVEFTAPATDRYYIEIDTKKSKITGKYTNTYNNTVTDRTDSSYATVQLLDAEGNVTFNDGTPSGSITNLTPDPIATVAGNKTVVIIDATAGAKYNLKLVGSYYATFNQVEGDLYYNIYTEENDTTATATEIEKGEKYNLGGWAHSSTNFVYKTYSYTPEESYSGVLKFKRTGYPYGSWEVYEEGTAAPIAKASSYSDGVVASIDYKAGKQYTFAFISTVELSSSVALEFSIEDAPAGSSIGNAIADVVVADGDAVKIERNGTMYTWYKLVVADDGTYKFSIDKFSSSYSYSGVCEVYDSTGTTKINGVTGKSGSSTFNADLTAGTYYVKTGFSSTSYMSTTYELSVVYLAPGADRTSPITTTLIDDTANGETFSLKGSAKGTWYKFRRADNSTFDIALVNPEEGASAKFYSGSSTTVSMDLTETPAKMSLRSTTTDYYVCVVSPTGGNVTFSKAVHIGEYTNAEENGFYEGRALADTYSSWHWYLGDDGYVWDPNTLTSAATATEVKPNVTTDETSGYKLWTNQGNSLEKIYTDGDMAFGVKQYSATGTVYAYAASKNCTGVDGSLGFKTASLSTTSGTIIGFLPTESGYEIGAMIDGHVYLNCTYEMIEGDNAHTKDATFKIKSSEGYTVGAYQVTKAEGTATWKMVITPIEFEPDAPEGPSEEPTVPGYVGTWEGEDGTIIINADGTGSITEGEGVANFKYEIDADGDLSLTDFDGDDYYEGLVQYNAETCAFSAYVYGNESYFELEMTKPSETPTDPTPETPAAPAYCGTYSKGSNTCIINADGTGSWNGYAFTYTYNEATKTFDVSNFGAFDDDENKFILSEDGSSLSVNLSGGYGDNVYIDVLAKA